MNKLGKQRIPFAFYTDYLDSNTSIFLLSNSNYIQYNFNGHKNTVKEPKAPKLHLEVIPPPLTEYLQAFESAMYHCIRGDSYLLNLTFQSRILTNLG